MKRSNTRYRKDEDGTWWFYGNAGRKRANIHRCPQCREEFISCESQPMFCGHACAATSRHAVAPKTTDRRFKRLKNADNERYSRDESGQWWYTPVGSPRTRAYIKRCSECGRAFLTNIFHRLRQGTCSKSCGIRAFHQQNPGARSREKSGHWKGGRMYDQHGYVMVLAPDHPSNAHTTRRYVQEHRLVMEKKLDRLLEPRERVHHKNGIKDDNREDNLELWAHSHPSGQRVQEQQHCPTCTCLQLKG